MSEQGWDDAIRTSGMRLEIQEKVGQMFNDAAISALEAAIRDNHDARIDAAKSGLVTGEGIDLPACSEVITMIREGSRCKTCALWADYPSGAHGLCMLDGETTSDYGCCQYHREYDSDEPSTDS